MKQIDFENGKIGSSIAQMAAPLLVAQMLSLLYGIVDRIYVGRIPGEGTVALSAIGLCFPVVVFITGMANMFGMGGAPLFSLELGRGNRRNAENIMNTSVRLLCITAVLITLTGEIFAAPLLKLFGAAGPVLNHALKYLRIYLSGTLFFMVATGMNTYMNAQGVPGIGMLTVMIGAVSNLILDPLFIFGMHMGISGAAAATVISQGLAAAFVLGFLFSGSSEFKIHLKKEEGAAGYFPYAGEIAGLGTVPFIMYGTNSIVQIICNGVLMRYGGEMYVSAMAIIMSVRQILDTPVNAVTEGTSAIISYNYGAGKVQNVHRAIGGMTVVAVFYTLLIWMMIQLNPAVFITVFSSDRTLVEKTIPALHLYFFAYIFQALQSSGQTVFKALNKKRQAVFFSLFRKVIMVIPLSCVLPALFGLGTDGVFMAEPVSNVVGGVVCFSTMVLVVRRELHK